MSARDRAREWLAGVEKMEPWNYPEATKLVEDLCAQIDETVESLEVATRVCNQLGAERDDAASLVLRLQGHMDKGCAP